MKPKIAGISLLVVFLLAAPAGSQDTGYSSLTTRFYDVYIGFAAQKDCVPKEGPYLTKLSHDLHIPDLRFVFKERDLGGITVNWSPVLGKGPVPSIPRLVFDTAGHIQAELCPYIECDGKIEKAWFIKQGSQFDGIFTTIPLEEYADIMDETLFPEATGNLRKDVTDISPSILYVHLICRGVYAWTGECIVRHQECGATADLEFYLALPKSRLLKGEEVSLEFPFNNDDIDAPGVLTVRFIPAGTIKHII
jgi:hypothetical protein